MGSYVFATGACVVFWDGRSIMLAIGDAWEADDPFVLARPEFFSDEPAKPHSSLSPEERAARPAKKTKLSDKDVSTWLQSLSNDQKKALAEKLLRAAQ